jgi:hypothetical protein
VHDDASSIDLVQRIACCHYRRHASYPPIHKDRTMSANGYIIPIEAIQRPINRRMIASPPCWLAVSCVCILHSDAYILDGWLCVSLLVCPQWLYPNPENPTHD